MLLRDAIGSGNIPLMTNEHADSAEPAESFHKEGPWIISSRGFRLRALGRAGMEYMESDTRLHIDSEAMATRDFEVYEDSLPIHARLRIIANLTRAWRWDGFGIHVQ
jgi:hypothetical protein